MSSTPSLEEIESSNRVLRQRVIIISLFMLIAWGLIQTYKLHEVKNMKLYDCIAVLEKMRDTPDLKSYIESHESEIQMQLIFNIEPDGILYRIRQSNYQDRMPIVDAITRLEERRYGLFSSENSIDVLGVSVPLKVWVYTVPFVLLFLFHDLTNVIYHRRSMLRKLSKTNHSTVRKSPDLLTYGRWMVLLPGYFCRCPDYTLSGKHYPFCHLGKYSFRKR